MRLNQLTYFIMEVNAAIDTGKYLDIGIEDVERQIESHNLIPWLKNRCGADVDFSLFDEFAAEGLNRRLDSILGGYKGNERRKWAIQNSGLCLLVVWAAELIQRGEWEHE